MTIHPTEMTTNMIFILCKYLDDPPERIEHAWMETRCALCEAKLRLTNRTANGMKIMGADTKPLCRQCAGLGPEEVIRQLDL